MRIDVKLTKSDFYGAAHGVFRDAIRLSDTSPMRSARQYGNAAAMFEALEGYNDADKWAREAREDAARQIGKVKV